MVERVTNVREGWGSAERRGGRQWIIVPFVPKHFHSRSLSNFQDVQQGLQALPWQDLILNA